jgi:transcriptional regulator GlxA family with amidase domain
MIWAHAGILAARMDKTRYAFLTLPNYSLIAVTNALEVLRMANRVAGRDIYEWSIASLDGRPVPASSGLELTPTVALDKIGKVERHRRARGGLESVACCTAPTR